MSGEYEADQDPNGAGTDAGTEVQPTPAAQPAGRTYTDADMAAARRSFEDTAARREAKLRQEFEQRFVAREQPKPVDPWAEMLDPAVAPKFRAALDAELERSTAPFKQELQRYKTQQEDLEFANAEARIRSTYKDYAPNRQAILDYAISKGITDVDLAYHGWRSQTQWQDPEAIGKKYLADYQKKKATQSAGTPLAEGRGGGAPSTKTNFRTKDGKLDKDAMDAAALEILHASES